MQVFSVRIGQAIQIGEAAVVKVDDKSGRMVRLIVASTLAPIRLLADGLIPARFTVGVTGEPRRVLEPIPAHQ